MASRVKRVPDSNDDELVDRPVQALGYGHNLIDYGVVNFVRNRREAKAEYLRVAENIDARTLLRFMTKQWRLVRRAQLSNAASPARRKKN